MGKGRRSLLGLTVAVAACASCSSPGHRASGGTLGAAALVAAAKASLAAESAGLAAGNPTVATSLDSGEEATDVGATATAVGSQIAHGNKASFAFRVLDARTYPLDGGATDFIAFVRTEDEGDASVNRRVELFQRSGGSGHWTGFESAWFNDNIDLPQVRLTEGSAHFLSPAEMQAAGAQPMAIASRYVSAMNTGTSTGRLGPDTFAASTSTSGVISSDTDFIEKNQTDGGASVQWTARPGGAAVQLTEGVLVFCLAEESFLQYRDTVGRLTYFDTQDPQERSYGGLLAPGNYSSISTMRAVTLAVVVPPSGLPDVVGLYSINVAVKGTVARVSSS